MCGKSYENISKLDGENLDDLNFDTGIADKLDGLLQFQLLFPLSQAQLKEILNCIEERGLVQEQQLLEILKREFDNYQDWVESYSKISDLSIGKFFTSSIKLAINNKVFQIK